MDYLAIVAGVWKWEANIDYHFLRDCAFGDFPAAGCSATIPRPENNGKNEIMFDATPEGGFLGALGIADFDYEFDNHCKVPRPGSRLCLKKRVTEVDIFIEPRSTGWATVRDTATCNSRVKTFYVENILMHEMGHAIGLPHSRGGADIMYRARPTCQNDNWWNNSLTETDKNMVRAIYGEFAPVDVAIFEPM